ncbi:MMPL family transporter [Cellulomonas soli]|uniref:Membrane protein n=1 Tax=Cellulomonas soli TaxID=931535 RepID=A0A512P8P0_9CELL|nr:MMPL family transporter [Cellulomonas soli]NYI57721.1 RND superfamily putative drug exporter [Cellulomonas soli]GEP67502.1 membrane protein [Cellulomonas soli]
MAEVLYRWGRACARRARTVVVVWLAVIALAGLVFAVGRGPLTTSFDIPGTPTAQVTDQLARELPDLAGASGTIVFHTQGGSAFTDAQRAQVAEVVAALGQVDHVVAATDPFATQAQIDTQTAQVADGQAQLAQARDELTTAQAQLDAARAQVAQSGLAGAAATEAGAQVDAQQAQLDAGAQELEARSAQLSTAATLLDLAGGIRLVSEDGSAALSTVAFDATQLTLPDEVKAAVMQTVEDRPVDGVAADFSGTISQEVPQVIGVGEAVGVLLAGVVLLVMLGTFVGAGLPIVSALVGVAVGVLASLALSGLVDMASVTLVLGVMLGLAVGIDYSLFIINRHRVQLRLGVDLEESIGLANGTSGNAVVFAGSTVLIALLALNVTGVPFLGLMGTVGAICVGVAILVAITLTPAMLALVGRRVLPRREREPVAAAAPVTPVAAGARPMRTRRAVATLVLGVAALGVLAIPSASMRLGLPDGSAEPVESTQYRAYTTTRDAFGAGANGPLLVVAEVVDAPAEEALTAAQAEIATQLAAVADVAAVAPVAASADRSVLAFQVVPLDGPDSESTQTLVEELRALSPLPDGTSLGVAGQASGNIDISVKLADVLPLYLAVVVGLSLVIMMIAFRSVLVPVVATAGFMLSLAATYGGLVAVFQWGWLGPVFGVHDPGTILSFLPIILVGILFGLAMDYQLFLVSGMREAFVHGASAREAVSRGFRAGRTVVLAAGLIMVAVFSGFVFSESAIIRSLGFGLAFGVLVDAFVVRILLVPAAMHLLGGAAWWMPRWLDRVVPNVDVEGAALERRHHAV